MIGDSKHEIIYSVKLFGGGVLHRFNNPAGVPYSSIYVDGTELFSSERAGEEAMIRRWNKKMRGRGES